ncbi:S8 family peptidase [Thalassotalea psychrophila]|uniref:S8 family peptidase n=1 Tax=Thalassotalea psychrophila TaxID=3065647 RepID=A0ABY9TWG5_9GAMM|nr:S8 family peptidase [Colwelliaceae bacterium SQ149]
MNIFFKHLNKTSIKFVPQIYQISFAFVLTISCLISSSALAENIPAIDADSLIKSISSVKKSPENGVYLIRLKGNPIAAYNGGIKGLKATKPKPNKKFNPNSKHVIAYGDYLTNQHDTLLKELGSPKKIYSYKYAYNGFSAVLTSSQVAKLNSNSDVLSVVADEKLKPDTVSTASFLQLDGINSDGLWEHLGGKDFAGEDIIVGIIDSGVWPESESFSDRTGTNKNNKSNKLSYQQIPGWHGKCTPGESFPASSCNQKLIGAQWFNSGFGGDKLVKSQLPYEYASARDAAGHGSHTMSTAAGNSEVEVSINGTNIGVATGMAPRARVAAYKVCWGYSGEGGCFGSDSVAAIDQAVADGVDVLNFSISGSSTSFMDQVEIAFLFAADAGIFVAASAGNSGPDASTVAHNSPWLTTVAASTHDRGWGAIITTNGDGVEHEGVSLGDGVGPAEMVYSLKAAADGKDLEQVRECFPGTLDAEIVAGKIVVCDRGSIARVDKSKAVAMAGGIGMVLANVSPSSLNADFHSVPSIHVDVDTGNILRAYAINNGTDGGSLSAGSAVTNEAPMVAEFSSRGPALAGSGDLLKPDIMAPGVDVIAAVSPPGNGGESFSAYSGTSMSSPHMAGLAALMKQAHPTWSPAAIKSAFMTTATQTTNEGNLIPGTPFAYGAGAVQPNKAVNPGLVYDAGWNDWFWFLCGTGAIPTICPPGSPDPSNMNYPSIAIGSLAGNQTVTRTVTSVSDAYAVYTPVVDGLEGIMVSFDPKVIKILPGESVTYEVTFSNVDAAIDTYATGGISWVDGTQIVRSPVAIKPVKLAAPAEVFSDGAEGSLSFDITFGYSGNYSAMPLGLVPAATIDGNVEDDPSNDFNVAIQTCDFDGGFPFVCTGITWHVVLASVDADMVRISLFDEYTDGVDDLDLYVWDAEEKFVGSSGNGTSAEQVDIAGAGSPFYLVAVHGWQTDGVEANYSLFSWAPAADEDNMTVTAPTSAVLGTTETITVEWEGLDAKKYLGVITHSDGSVFKRTLVNIQND